MSLGRTVDSVTVTMKREDSQIGSDLTLTLLPDTNRGTISGVECLCNVAHKSFTNNRKDNESSFLVLVVVTR